MEFINITSFSSTSIEELLKKLPKGTHCFLIVNTTQVLISIADLKTRDSEIVNQAFPSLKNSEFYYEILKTSQQAFVSICRKSFVDGILLDLDNSGISVLGFHLGFGPVKNLVGLIPLEKIKTSTHTLSISNAEIIDYQEHKDSLKEVYVIEDIEVDSNHILSLAGLFDYLGDSGLATNSEDETKKRYQIFRQKTFFKKGLIAGAVLLLLCLLLNALLFNNYYSKLQKLEQQAQVVLIQKESYLEQQKEIKRKEQIVQNILLSGNSKSSFFLNRIISSKPKTIQFSLFEYQPLQKSVRPEKPILYLNNLIKVEGSSNNKAVFNQWIQTIEKYDWIDSVETYQYSENNNSFVTFGINLMITDVNKK